MLSIKTALLGKKICMLNIFYIPLFLLLGVLVCFIPRFSKKELCSTFFAGCYLGLAHYLFTEGAWFSFFCL